MNAQTAVLTARTDRREAPARKGVLFFLAANRAARKAKKQITKERIMQTERVQLHFQQGSSDKVYHVQLENVEDQWSVKAQWGRRGSSLQNDTKVSGVWDLLSVNDTDYRIQPYEIRYVHLTQHFRGVRGALQVCETAMTVKDKKHFVKRMHEANAEGFVCKNRYAAYAAGRAGQHFKCKFVTTASFIVGPKPEKKAGDGHRSIAVYLLDSNQPRFMGTVGVPDRYPLPRVEQIVEVRYLYCHPGPDGKLIQAKYFGAVRDDIDRAECTVSQLKFGADDSEPIEA
jgi:hypothetical protein